MYTFFWYPKCSTCKKAKAWLDENHVAYETIDMIETPPTAEQLKKWIKASGLPTRRFFNTSGILYREKGLKDQVDSFSVEEASELMATDGKLIRRPILVLNDEFLANGFKEAEYKGAIQ